MFIEPLPRSLSSPIAFFPDRFLPRSPSSPIAFFPDRLLPRSLSSPIAFFPDRLLPRSPFFLDRLSSRSPPVVIEQLQAVSRSNTALGAFYRRIRSRAGAPKAITATAHKIARLFYVLWTKQESYVDQGADYYEQQYRARLVKNLKKKAQSLGFELVEATPA